MNTDMIKDAPTVRRFGDVWAYRLTASDRYQAGDFRPESVAGVWRPIPIPEGYRLVELDEVLEATDRFCSPSWAKKSDFSWAWSDHNEDGVGQTLRDYLTQSWLPTFPHVALVFIRRADARKKAKRNAAARSSLARGSGLRPSALRLFNAVADELSGQPEIKRLTDILDRHHRLAAEARAMLHNNGYGPNSAQQLRIDNILREIAGLPDPNKKDEQRPSSGH
jgi:hypothetical protein